MTKLLSLLSVVFPFLLGIVGNKWAEVFQVSGLVLVVLTLGLMLCVVLINLLLEEGTEPSSTTNPGALSPVPRLAVQAWFPKTYLSAIPLGVALGLLVAAAVGSTLGQRYYKVFSMEFILSFSFYQADVAITAIGLLVLAMLLLFVRPLLVSGMAWGFGLGVPPALVMTAHPNHTLHHSVFGYLVLFSIVAYWIPRLGEPFQRWGQMLTRRLDA